MLRRLLSCWITWVVATAAYLDFTFAVLLLPPQTTKGREVLPLAALEESHPMKAAAISNHERALIIRQLADRGKWEGERMGAKIQIVRFNAAQGSVICYAAAIGKTMFHGRSGTVYDAVHECNEFIAAKSRPLVGRAPNPLPGMGSLRHATGLLELE